MVEGTQTVKVDLEIEEDKPRRFLVKTKMYIGDWYGADWDDLNGKGIKEFATGLLLLSFNYRFVK
ncbi:hypothetical protein GYM73_01610 [Apibacter sp. ESL0432]|uniref:hypothetical protein n=1 Tax=Apibacter sp. ESL0432 TaxID=2704652 RepID=UPI001C6A074F|nr:hypothetical protein [Apibacter sp. ESL0432]QYN48369.1 hypothetical protein GYM73_01610 [Apibacter sp. ESL0432]